jgi:hypothetical protein
MDERPECHAPTVDLACGVSRVRTCADPPVGVWADPEDISRMRACGGYNVRTWNSEHWDAPAST